MRNLLIATKNAHKTAEFRAVLGDHWNVSDLCQHPQIAAPEETGQTFVENATLKALSASRFFDGWVLADDSGLEVDALHGAPGVISARYAGSNATDAQNRQHLLRRMELFPELDQRRARFRCVLALAQDGSMEQVFSGECEGHILLRESGEGGFGYDPLFVPEGYSQSFGELSAATKNSLSHRAKATARLLEWLRSSSE